MQQISPFRLAANVVSAVKLEVDTRGCVNILVLSGGPVFAWFDRKLSDAEALAAVNAPDYDAAASLTLSPRIDRGDGVGSLSLFAAVDTIGFVIHERNTR